MDTLIKIDINIFSMLILAIVYFSSIALSESNIRESSHFFYMIYTTFAMLVLDTVIWILVGKEGSLVYSSLFYIYFAYLAIMPIAPAFWGLYITRQENPRLLKNTYIKILFFVPALINFSILAATFNTGYTYYIDSSNFYHISIGIIWLGLTSLIPIAYSLILIIRFRYFSSRNTHFAFLFFAIIPTAASIFDWIYVEAFTLIPSISLSLLVLFLFVEISVLKQDTLTKTNNRKQLLNHLKKLIKYNKEFTLVMLDFDKLKYINDSYGHLAGDEALVLAASIVKKHIRSKDYFARYAGDEFMMVINSANKIHIEQLIERINSTFNYHNTKNKTVYNVSMSFGYAINKSEFNNVEELIEIADKNMFRNKKLKR